MHPNYRGVAFLLSLGGLPIACNNDDRGPTGGSDSMTGTDPTGNTGTGTDTTGGPTGGTTDDAPTTDPTAASTTTGGTTDPQPTTFMTSDTGTSLDTGDETGPATDPTCVAYGAHIVECTPRYAMYQEYITKNCEYAKAYGLGLDGQPCEDAYDAFYVCLSMTDCAVLEQGEACMEQDLALDAACPSMQSGDDTGTSGDTGTSA